MNSSSQPTRSWARTLGKMGRLDLQVDVITVRLAPSFIILWRLAAATAASWLTQLALPAYEVPSAVLTLAVAAVVIAAFYLIAGELGAALLTNAVKEVARRDSPARAAAWVIVGSGAVLVGLALEALGLVIEAIPDNGANIWWIGLVVLSVGAIAGPGRQVGRQLEKVPSMVGRSIMFTLVVSSGFGLAAIFAAERGASDAAVSVLTEVAGGIASGAFVAAIVTPAVVDWLERFAARSPNAPGGQDTSHEASSGEGRPLIKL